MKNTMSKNVTRAVLLVAALGMTACTNPNRFGSGSDGALGSVQDPTSPAYFNQTIGDRVFFLVDQSTLTPEAKLILTQQAQWLLTNTAYSAIIEGHADEQGTREYNFALSSRRAASVQDFLISQGVPTTRIKSIPYGKERPIAVCSTEECYGQNRRGVTVISAGAGL